MLEDDSTTLKCSDCYFYTFAATLARFAIRLGRGRWGTTRDLGRRSCPTCL